MPFSGKGRREGREWFGGKVTQSASSVSVKFNSLKIN